MNNLLEHKVRMFNNSVMVATPLPFPIRMFIEKYDKIEYLTDPYLNETFKEFWYNLLILCKKFIYDVDNGVTYDDIYKTITSHNIYVSDNQEELSEFINVLIYTIKEVTILLVSNDILNNNIYIHELTENHVVLEIEKPLGVIHG